MKRGALILCGGGSRRMGRDKAGLPFGSETLLQRIVRLVAPLVEDVVIVARPGQTVPALPDRVRVVYDEIPDRGPLSGLRDGMAASRADVVFATACDVPFLRPGFVELLFDCLGAHDAAVAETDGFLHPLAAVYRTSVRSVADDLLAEDRLRPLYLLESVRTRRVSTEEIRRVDPDLESLENLNTQEAYEAARRRVATRDAT